MVNTFGQLVAIKYQFPCEDLDALLSVSLCLRESLDNEKFEKVSVALNEFDYIQLGFEKISDKFIAECKSKLVLFRHLKIGAPVMFVSSFQLPGRVSIPNVPKSINLDTCDRMRLSFDVLSFQHRSEKFNQEVLLSGKIPTGHFNFAFQFSGVWQRDAANTKNLAFDGVSITLDNIALDNEHVVLSDHVRRDVPSSWDPAALAMFIEIYGTFGTIKGSCIVVKDFADLCYHWLYLREGTFVPKPQYRKKMVSQSTDLSTRGNNVSVNSKVDIDLEEGVCKDVTITHEILIHACNQYERFSFSVFSHEKLVLSKDGILRMLLHIPSSGGRKQIITHLMATKQWRTYGHIVKSYLGNALRILNQMSDSQMISFTFHMFASIGFGNLNATVLSVKFKQWDPRLILEP